MTGIGVRGGASPARAILWPSRALWRCSSRYGLNPNFALNRRLHAADWAIWSR
ncbi:Mycobacterium numidiamassiliense ORFan [Mycobacterium numidiamassiliense]|uniref:Mycobacterium numidiamassiliense ORFan n=1 Tax=Mycobacterium numidiamassiliense TaxID=1841861 RepID=A0A2U3P3D2_9MYCO|nr:Mycobacterium numidiamassiliense ORFan [Mycobacterium numidiamassiliense]